MTALEACAEWLAAFRATTKKKRSANMAAILGMYGEHNAPGLSELKRATANVISVALSLSAASVEQSAELKRLRARVEELEKR
jgi:hypothetical protein